MQTLRTMALAATVAAVAGTPLSADIIEQILVKVNGEIITKTDLEQRQIAALRQRPEVQSLRGDDAALAKVLAEVTPQVIVDAVDELLLHPARQGARLRHGRRAVQEHPREHPQGEQDRDRGAIRGRRSSRKG